MRRTSPQSGAPDAAHAYGLTDDEADTAAQALCLRTPLNLPLLSMGHGLDDNAAWLTRVARHYRSPLMDDLESRIATLRKPA